MKVNKLTLNSPLFPEPLRHIPDPPKQLFYIGDLAGCMAAPRLAIVGSRKVSAYGTAVTLKLAAEAAQQGITVVSGLALGVDGLAHQATIDAGGKTVAVMAGGLSQISPARHRQLAEDILRKGGAIVTEYPLEVQPYKMSFVARDRLISGLSDAVLITEAAAKSGSLHTANFALEQGKSVMAVPGNITSELSIGTNNLIKTGATPVTDVRDILAAMDLTQVQSRKMAPLGATDAETALLSLIHQGVSDASDLLTRSQMDPAPFNQTLTMLEITGKIRPLGAGHWGLA